MKPEGPVMNQSNIVQKMISSLMITLLILPISAQATNNTSTDSQFEYTCKPLINLHQKFKETGCSAESKDSTCKGYADQIKELGGENMLGECMQADIAITAKDREENKRTIYGIAAGTCTTLAITSWLSVGTAEVVCGSASVVAGGLGISQDILGKKEVKAAREEYDQTCQQLKPDLKHKFHYGWKGTGAGVAGVGSATTAILNKGASNLGCIVCAATMGAMAVVSWGSYSNLKKMEIKSVDSATTLKEATKDQVNSFGTGSSMASNDSKKSVKPSSGGSPDAPASSNCLAAGNSSSQIEQCLVNQIPEAAAIIGNKDMMDQIKKTYKGKGLGDLVKAAKGKENLNEFLASSMGVSGQTMDKMMAMNEKFAKNSGIQAKIESSYAMGGFSGAGAASAPKADGGMGLGGGSAAVTSNLNDATLGEEPLAKEEDPTEALFRQLDLMTPSQVYENKNISLFVRAAHRYRKNADKLERLNSALEVRTPASVKK
jgi:hypothetical protein